MRSDKRIVMVGAGQAASQCALALRNEGWQGEILLVGDEGSLPYHRPPLSKSYLCGELAEDKLLIRPAQFYQQANIDVRLNTLIRSIDRQNKCVVTEQGEAIGYDKLCLATGVRARKLNGIVGGDTGDDLQGVFYLRTMEDIERMKHYMHTDIKHEQANVVIIGGGYIGLEVAAALVQKNHRVSVLEAEERVLKRVTSPVISQFFSALHGEHGVSIRTHVEIKNLWAENGVVKGVKLVGGSVLDADIVLVGIGVEVNDQLAKQAGLKTKQGIEVNAYCQTSDADIFAVGDCTWHVNPIYQKWLRVESVQNANDQAKIAAKNMAGELCTEQYSSLPWFWSDQYDVKLQIAGLSSGYDDCRIDGEIADKKFSVSYYREGCLISVDTVNQPRVFMQAKKQIVDSLRLFDERY